MGVNFNLNKYIFNTINNIALLPDNAADKGVTTSSDLVKLCDNFDMDTILEDTRHLATADLSTLNSSDEKFAFFVNVYNLMMIHAAFVEAKAVRVIKYMYDILHAGEILLYCCFFGSPLCFQSVVKKLGKFELLFLGERAK